MSKPIKIFDSTLRDGAQAEGISFSVADKLKIVKALDELGIDYIEAGNPGSNPKDLAFFEDVHKLTLQNAKLTAFGSTRRANIAVDEDDNVKSLLLAGTDCVAIFGKSWDFHVTDIIRTSLDENIAMIEQTVQYFVKHHKEVIFDAEHFFDGYKNNASYALLALEAAVKGGASTLCLCDTNGGMFPNDIEAIVADVMQEFPNIEFGIHCHNDCGLSVANSISAVFSGVTHVQGTFIGYGERCGNASLATIIPNLQIKKGYSCIPEQQMTHLTSCARFIADVSNIQFSRRTPFVGTGAFAHKGGMHIDGVMKSPCSFEHMDPELVGNERRFLTSEVAGRTTILKKIQKVNPNITKDSPETTQIIERLKELEQDGYQFEAAESTFELVIRKHLGKYKPFFELEQFKIIGEEPFIGETSATAMIKVKVDGKSELTASEGQGPVNALDKALRKALEVFYPQLSDVHLTDYKVRVLDSGTATASKVRVLIESSDGVDSWSTVGVSHDIIKASWIALVDSIEYKLIKDIEHKFKAYL